MSNLLMLIPVALVLGALGLVGFLWALRSGQFEDLDGAANRILFDYDEIAEDPQGGVPDDAASAEGGPAIRKASAPAAKGIEALPVRPPEGLASGGPRRGVR